MDLTPVSYRLWIRTRSVANGFDTGCRIRTRSVTGLVFGIYRSRYGYDCNSCVGQSGSILTCGFFFVLSIATHLKVIHLILRLVEGMDDLSSCCTRLFQVTISLGLGGEESTWKMRQQN